ncbi:hypothetical protein L195_g009771 [Trifolium pratense]|uniref:Reverse transcriptase zinc-binding domain-containing protein n=1 Tax=Trifolium pratense TaxID=57577 RepID=A0A2K3PCV9_TRIPR|nr:hypothetical protein L195_g009771 [Trifolium pratense]
MYTQFCTVSWSKVCTSYEAGDLDLRPLANINSSLLLQLSWKFLSSDEQWATLCRAKYLKHGNPAQTYMKSSIWHGIKDHVPTVKANTIWLIGSGHSDGVLSAKSAYSHLFPQFSTVAWAAWIWQQFIPPSAFVVWRSIHDKLPTDDNLMRQVFQSCKNSWSVHIHNLALATITQFSIVFGWQGMSAPLVDGFTTITEHSILERLRLKPRFCNAPAISFVIWKTPSLPWIKVNTDGSVMNLPPSAA